MTTKKEAYEQKMQAQLDEWNAEIDKLRAKADKAGADTKLEYNKKIEELRSMQKTAVGKLGEIKGASDDAWDELRAGANEAWDSLDKAFKNAASKFK
jgi:uncharacterized coiled-coil DUF342 family protein